MMQSKEQLAECLIAMLASIYYKQGNCEHPTDEAVEKVVAAIAEFESATRLSAALELLDGVKTMIFADVFYGASQELKGNK